MKKGPLEELYFEKLLEHFPIGKCEEDFYCIMTSFIFEEDREGHEKAVKVFKDKTWDQVVITSSLKLNDVDFMPLTTKGKLYYLPALLNNFYNQKLYDELWFYTFLIDLAHGSFKSSKNLDEVLVHRKGFDYFMENLTNEQSKMVALFLANTAILSDDDLARQALASHWGDYLLF